VREILLPLHIAAGTLGLALLPVAALAPKGRALHVWAGRGFGVAALALSLTAIILGVLDPALIGLAVLGVLTLGWALAGWVIVRRKPRLPGGWPAWHVRMFGSAGISFVTGFVVQRSDGHLLAWILPTVVGSWLIARASTPAPRGRVARPATRQS
jgi:hypothetical protein